MERKLYLEKPLLYGRLHIAYPMISFMQHPQGEEFLYNYFVNLECHRYEEYLDLCYMSQLERESTSWIHYLNDYNRYFNYVGEDKQSVIDDFKLEIDNGRYIYVELDDFYLPDKGELKSHYIHINLIYGYNNEKKLFYTYGYDGRHRLRIIELPYKAAKEALDFPVVEVFKPDLNVHFMFDKKHFWMQICDFLESKNSLVTAHTLAFEGLNKNDFIYGLAVYDRIIQHIEEIPQSEPDIRNTYMLYEWSKLNWLRIIYLKKNKFYNIPDTAIQEAEKICTKAQMGHYLMIKYIYSGNAEILLRLSEIIKKHREDIIVFYEKLKKISE